MKLAYVAGPYRGCTPEAVDLHIQSATQVGKLVAEKGYYPVIPHLNTRHFERLCTLHDEFYLTGTLELMRRCDLVVLCAGWRGSSGALAEVAEAQRIGMRVVDGVDHLEPWPK